MFQVAANNFGRLRRPWLSTVFLERALAYRLDVPMDEEPGIEGFPTLLADKAEDGPGPPEPGYGPSSCDLPNPFRDPATSVYHRRIADMLVIGRRGLLAPAWVSSMRRVKANFDLKRWLPERPSCWTHYGPSMESPLESSYVATGRTDACEAAWDVVYDEFF